VAPGAAPDSRHAQYPMVRDALPYLHSSQADATFRFGLDLILAALKSELDSAA